MSIIKYCIAALATVSCMVATAQGGIVEREYWLDNNTVQSQSLGASPTTLDISSLPAGLHWFTMRVKDDQGVWSPAMTRAFIIPHEIDNSAATQIQRVEVWFDNNYTARQAIGASPATVDISSLPAGLHSLTIRAQDDLGLWSSQKTVYFIIPHGEVEEDVELVRYCYWFDDDVENLVVCELPVSGKTVAGVIEVDMATVPSGQHTIHWMIGASNGAWAGYYGEVNSMSFYNSRGDVNSDGVVDIVDATALINYLLYGDSTAIDLDNANCDLSGGVDIVDATTLINYLLYGAWP
jgi:hypothetical protein